jgi:nitrite reductase/ring-hydroxylating ferredoxin subunit
VTAQPVPASPLSPDEIAAVRRPYRAASLLPGRAYHDPAIHEFERQQWFRRDWIVVGREDDAPSAGTYFLAEIDDEPLLVARGRDGELRAFYNVCRHRGTTVVEEPCGKAVRFHCPYHAWIYDLEGKLVRAKHTEDLDDFSFDEFGLRAVRMETWQGFVFVNLAPAALPLVEWLGDLPPHLANRPPPVRRPNAERRRARGLRGRYRGPPAAAHRARRLALRRSREGSRPPLMLGPAPGRVQAAVSSLLSPASRARIASIARSGSADASSCARSTATSAIVEAGRPSR